MNLLATLTKSLSKVRFGAKKNAPDILTGISIGCMGAAVVTGCYVSYKKLPKIVEEHKEEMDKIRNSEDENIDVKKETARVYFHTGIKCVKAYGMTFGFAVASGASAIASRKKSKEIEAGLAAAYANVVTEFGDYRERVIDRFGEAVDNELFNNLEHEEVEETETDEKGKEKKVKKTVTKANGAGLYVRYFTKTNRNWERDKYYNDTIIDILQSEVNAKLKARGFLTLNDVFDVYDFKRCRDGMVIGWKYDYETAPTVPIVVDKEDVLIPDEFGDYVEAIKLTFHPDKEPVFNSVEF